MLPGFTINTWIARAGPSHTGSTHWSRLLSKIQIVPKTCWQGLSVVDPFVCKSLKRAMKQSSAIAFLVTFSLVTSAVDKKAKSDFSLNWKKDLTLEKGQNLRLASDQTASSVQRRVASHPQVGSNFVGVAVNIRNQSPFKLARPKTFAYCGYQVGHSFSTELRNKRCVIPGGREEVSWALQEASQWGNKSRVWGSFPFPQQGRVACEQLRSDSLAGEGNHKNMTKVGILSQLAWPSLVRQPCHTT